MVPLCEGRSLFLTFSFVAAPATSPVDVKHDTHAILVFVATFLTTNGHGFPHLSRVTKPHHPVVNFLSRQLHPSPPLNPYVLHVLYKPSGELGIRYALTKCHNPAFLKSSTPNFLCQGFVTRHTKRPRASQRRGRARFVRIVPAALTFTKEKGEPPPDADAIAAPVTSGGVTILASLRACQGVLRLSQKQP